MKLLRILSVLAALLVMTGEGYRSWGAGRPAVFWMDDMLAGTMMIAAAFLVGRPTFATHSFFSAAWGVAVGMLYGSFFGKLYDPASANPGNFSIGVLTWLLGLAFILSIAGLIASILLPNPRR
ncbi:hypothetical protein [Sphingomonas psychrotolerans]|uniref:Uncharacterized protein n=1 Tax=Sphingomonas psychrotolerans TaxID=1327635 RepID=A0A2K8MIV8_9SPHN|nr:hypothetical protein [Sphingomonas psychrotolerans]ATY31679.1 hypothetical protein CVN68_06605 [Sphingomonas psychrotolerans]